MALAKGYQNRPPLSLSEKLDLPLRMFIWVPIQLTLNIVRTLLACLVRALPLRPFLACAAIRTFLYTFTPRQLQLLVPSTVDTYRAFIRDARARARRRDDFALLEQLREDIEVLPDGQSHLLWLGDRSKATRFVYFFHGGGYMVPAIRGHLEWCLQAYVLAPRAAVSTDAVHVGGGEEEEEEEDKVAVALLQYTLTPTARFPMQMAQAAAGLRHLLVEHRIRPSQLVVGGDSAGGSLTLQLLAHLLHPYPYPCPYPCYLQEDPSAPAGTSAAANPIAHVALGGDPLAGAFLVSPLTSGRTDSWSFREGKPCDMLSVGVFNNPKREMFHERRRRNLLGPGGAAAAAYLFPNRNLVETKAFAEGRNWALIGDVEDDKWLEGMGRVVRKVYVTCGRHEILRDQGIEFAERLRRTNSGGAAEGVQVQLEVADKEAHDFILLEGERRVVGDATTRMRSWFSKVWA